MDLREQVERARQHSGDSGQRGESAIGPNGQPVGPGALPSAYKACPRCGETLTYIDLKTHCWDEFLEEFA